MDAESVNIGSAGEGDTPAEGDSYAPEDGRTPKVIHKKKCKKGCNGCKCVKRDLKSFKEWLNSDNKNIIYVE